MKSKIYRIVTGICNTNCYLICNEANKEVIIIDPAENAELFKEQIQENGFKPCAILLTHGHFDHIMAVNDLRKTYHILVYCQEAEQEVLKSSHQNLSAFIQRNEEVSVTPDVLVKDGEILTLADLSIKVIHTPGHTIGGCCYYIMADKVLISGDTLFYESIGRTDFPKGNAENLLSAIKNKLMVLPDEVRVYPGHGEETTIGHERRNNPFLSERQNEFSDTL